MRPPLPLSVSVITLNEEANLRRCLESVRGLASEIVVLDSGSTDKTGEIARSLGAVFDFASWPGHVEQKNRALQRCAQPWVLGLDADEALTPELAESIRAAFGRAEPAVNGFWLNRRTLYLGEWIRHAWYPEWRLRLVRRQKARWTGLDPHDKLEVEGPTERLRGDLEHYSFRDFEDHFSRSIKYARIMSRSLAARGKQFHWYDLLLSPWAAFFKHLVLKQGWRDGWRGWLISGVKAAEVFAKYAFLLEDRLNGGRAPVVGTTTPPD